MSEDLAGIQKSAILLLSLSEEQAEQILYRMSADAADLVRREMAALRHVPQNQRREVLQQYRQQIQQEDFQAATDLVATDLSTLVEASVEDLCEALHDEHPQLVCTVLSMLSAQKSGSCISTFPVQRQVDVFCRMASLQPLDPVVRRRLIELISARIQHDAREVNEFDERIDQSLLAQVLDEAEGSDAQQTIEVEPLPENVAFDDLMKLEDSSLRKLLEEIEEPELAMSLRVASKQLRRRILRTLPTETAGRVRSSADALGPVHLGDAEAAQAKILRVLHRLEAAGDVHLEPQERS